MICIVAPRGEEHRSGAQTVDRALGVLRCFETGEDEIRLRDLADRSRLSLSTTHRLVRSLVAGGLLVQNPVTDRYALGPALVVLGRRAGAHLGYDAALPALTELAERSGESVNLGIRRGPDVLVVLDVASRSPLRFTQPAGSRVPVHSSAMGKCLLAFSDDPAREVAELPSLARLTEHTITERAELGEELQRVRAQGWALNDEERNQGVRTMAAPVLRADGTAAAAIAVQGPVVRIDDARLAELRDPLHRTAVAVATMLTATID